jgi:hypothetical protein
MPTAAPDISSAESIFKKPLPNVRQIHKQLNVSLEEKNARLRVLVGGSYRQLLGTAETIVEMRADIEAVEGKLGKVAGGCGMGFVGKKVAGLGKLGIVRGAHGDGEEMLGKIAKLKVLSGCAVVVGRLLRWNDMDGKEGANSRGKRLVTAAKVLVLSRLLLKSAADIDDDLHSKAYMEELRRKLASLRKRLLRGIGRTMESADGNRDELVHALCAYSLATSSGAKDVLRHFLHVRGEAMTAALEEDQETLHEDKHEQRVIRALELYTKTLLDVQALVPRRLSDSLSALKSKSLLKDESVRGLEGLRLDVYDKWFGDEIVFFTPYIRHDDLEGSQAVATLKGWAKKASEVLLQGFAKILESVLDFKTVVDLRTRVFEMWVTEGGKAKGFDSSAMLDGLRKVVNQRLIDQLEARVGKLHLIDSEVEAALGLIMSGLIERQDSLWDDEILAMELSHGAGSFKEAILASVHGRNNAVSRVVKSYETWRHLIDEMATTIDKIKDQRWNDDLDSLEDDLVLEHRQQVLSKEDPDMLRSRLGESLTKAFDILHHKLTGLLITYKESEHKGAIAIFILRILREIRSELPKQEDVSSFGLSLVPELHKILATTVSTKPVSVYTASLSLRKRVAGRALWEGSPELPIYPSPSTFRFLHDMASSMARAGSDLWSPVAVLVLKNHLCELLESEIEAIKTPLGDEKAPQIKVNGHDKTEDGKASNGVEPEDQTSEESQKDVEDHAAISKDILIQSLFDVMILKACLVPLNVSSNQLVVLEKSLKKQTDLALSSNERLMQGAQDYWKRTSLLLGLLAL